jgi:alkylated DNA repair dioxygenase AlkB
MKVNELAQPLESELSPQVVDGFDVPPDLIPPDEATRLLRIVRQETPWQQFVGGFGKLRPRLESWHGTAEHASYNRGMRPKPWTPALLEILGMVRLKTGMDFNSVLLNLYRDEHDSVDAHSDDEPEFGINPTIPSVSLGETRRFIFRNKATKERHILLLTHGSLVVMSGPARAGGRTKSRRKRSRAASASTLPSGASCEIPSDKFFDPQARILANDRNRKPSSGNPLHVQSELSLRVFCTVIRFQPTEEDILAPDSSPRCSPKNRTSQIVAMIRMRRGTFCAAKH